MGDPQDFDGDAFLAFSKAYALLVAHIKAEVDGKGTPTVVGLLLALQALTASTEVVLQKSGLNTDLLLATLSPDWAPKFAARFYEQNRPAPPL
jgi:hypothetical protein